MKNAVVTTGSFDGVHIGHKEIIKRINQRAEEIGGESVVVTFHPHPRIVLYPDQKDLKLLNSIEEKTMLLKSTGLNNLIVVNFTVGFSKISSHEFITSHIVGDLDAKVLVASHNHQFGHQRQGDNTFLHELAEKHDFRIEEIPLQDIEDETVSSTKIRKALFQGDIELANSYLGYEYFVTGKISHSDCNLNNTGKNCFDLLIEDKNKLIPPAGVYDIRLLCENKTVECKARINETGDYSIRVEVEQDEKFNDNFQCIMQFKTKLSD